MLASAIISATSSKFFATLSDGRTIEVADLLALAKALYGHGVPAHAVHFEWRAGQRMMTAGQRVALAANIRYMARESSEAPIAA